MSRWLGIALREDVVKRSLRVALVVGTFLMLINYSDRFYLGTLQTIDYFKMLLTYCVPYSVSTYASVYAVISHME
ncbi:nitrate/nitrite transporter NrtS [Kineobactrum salinum]|uniref:nitrate/nitrite transporter NrtS n=1 Tax=Kineobactrum salinum TaxID=2708301 RepID=UPI0018D6266D